MLGKIIQLLLSFSIFRKYGKKITLLIALFFFVVITSFLYSDVVEYLIINDMNEYLKYALLTKWALIILSFLLAIYTVASVFITSKDKTTLENQENHVNDPEIVINVRDKEYLKSRGDLAMEKILKNTPK